MAVKSIHPNINSAGQLKKAAIQIGVAVGEINSLGYSVGAISYLNCFYTAKNEFKLGNLKCIAHESKLSLPKIQSLLKFKYSMKGSGGNETVDYSWRVCPVT
jgi:hypothetical protein